MAECRWNISRTGEVYGRDPEEVQDDGLQGHDPMESNLKLLIDASLEAVDATMYRQMIGFLMYLTYTRPYICFVVDTLRHVHLIAAKHILRYLKGTVDFGIKYKANQKLTWKVMLIQIGQAVPSIKRALQGVASIWDQV